MLASGVGEESREGLVNKPGGQERQKGGAFLGGIKGRS